ncbi:MAG: ADP-ribosylglycohydrolase family protein [Saprospiraceae bacterium]
MLGAIIGDVIGSVYEKAGLKTIDFELFIPESHFTDDTVLTIAVMDCLINQKDYTPTFQEYGRRYQQVGFSKNFKNWLAAENPQPYPADTNGAAMRVSPIAWFYDRLESVQAEAERSAVVSHQHPDAINAAVATASAIFLARKGSTKTEIKNYLEAEFGYNLSRTLEAIRPTYTFATAATQSVPEAIIAFLESFDYEEAIRNAISLGGDADTQASIAGALAEAFYKKIPTTIATETIRRLPLGFIETLDEFYSRI